MAGEGRHLAVHDDPQVAALLERLAIGARLVFFAGLPGTGKSLFLHQFAHLARAAGREIHLLQWDVARPAFEASRAGARYPMVDSVTHGIIRKSVGAWVRTALVGWHRHHPDRRHLLVGETPLVGGRFIELAHRMPDPAEPLLSAASCRFVIPVPSREVRRFLEAERARRISQPAHDREREDAPPDVLRALWEQLVEAGRALGVAGAGTEGAPPPYDPVLYERIYRLVLGHRHVEMLTVGTLLQTETFSVYEFAIPTRDLVPAPDEANHFIEATAQRYPEAEDVQRDMGRWYVV